MLLVCFDFTEQYQVSTISNMRYDALNLLLELSMSFASISKMLLVLIFDPFEGANLNFRLDRLMFLAIQVIFYINF